jgi:hypothetical protein
MSQDLQSPFLRDYTDNIDEMIADMAQVVIEVAKFLKERYGGKYEARNLAAFLWVFTAAFLLKDDVDIDDYCRGLKLTYEYLRGKCLEEG